MQGFPTSADLHDVTALAMYDAAVPRSRAVAPARTLTRSVLGSFHEPNMLTVSILAATGIVIAARHPIARMIGTEVDTPPISTTPATAPVSPPSPTSQAPALSLPAPVPTHAPRNPFAALVQSTGPLLASAAPANSAVGSVATPHIPEAKVTTTGATDSTPAAASTSCAGTMHRVAAGESLWTLAARAVHSDNVGTVNIAWRRIYAANRDVLGGNPSLIHVGENICVPTKLS